MNNPHDQTESFPNDLPLTRRDADTCRISATDARSKFADLVDFVRVEDQRVILCRHGKDLAAIIPMDDLDILVQLIDDADNRAIRAALAEDGAEFVPWEQVKQELGLDDLPDQGVEQSAKRPGPPPTKRSDQDQEKNRRAG